eukprot:7223917-Pyramimonas_sp.AAC.1
MRRTTTKFVEVGGSPCARRLGALTLTYGGRLASCRASSAGRPPAQSFPRLPRTSVQTKRCLE